MFTVNFIVAFLFESPSIKKIESSIAIEVEAGIDFIVILFMADCKT